SGVDAHPRFAPRYPARPKQSVNLLIVYARAVGLNSDIALMQGGQHEGRSAERFASAAGCFAISIVDESDLPRRIAPNDQVALRFDQAAGALFRFLQFPIAIGKRFMM